VKEFRDAKFGANDDGLLPSDAMTMEVGQAIQEQIKAVNQISN
jgi:hypothetical protein